MSDEYQLRKDIDKLKIALDNLDLSGYASSDDLDKSFVKFDSDLSRLSTDLTTLSNNLTLLNEDLYDAEGNLLVTEEDLNQTKQSLTTLSSALTTLRTDLTDAETTLEDLESCLTTTRSSLSQALTDLTALGTELNTAKGRITTTEGNITTAQQSISAHQQAITSLNSELTTAKGRITATEQNITSAQQSISSHQSSISSLNSELDSATTRLSATEADILSLSGSLSELDGSLDALSTLLVDFEGDLNDFDAELVEAGIDKTELNSDIYALVSQICLVKKNITDTDTKIDDTVDDINNLNTSVVPNLKNKIGEAKSSGDTAQSQLAQTKLDLEDLNDNVFPNLVGAIDDALESGETAQTNLTSAITKINDATADDGTFARLHGSIDNAQQAADDAQDNLDTSIADIENLTGTVFPNLRTRITTVQSNIATAQGDIADVQLDIGSEDIDRTVDGSLQTQITQLPTYIQKIWCCTSSSESEITKLPNVGSGRIGIEFTELARKCVRDNGTVDFVFKIVSPSNQIYTSPPLSITSPNVVSNKAYISYTFTEFGLYTIFCENLTYTLQVGDVNGAAAPLSLVKAPQSMYGLTVSTFSDELSVCMMISGTLNGDSNLPSGGSIGSLGYVDTSKDRSNPNIPSQIALGVDQYFYSPYEEIHTPTHTSSNDVSKFILTSTGELKMLNMGGKSVTVRATFYYPLKSRIKIHNKVIITSTSQSTIQSGGNNELYGTLKYEHGVIVPNEKVYFFVKED